MVLPVFDDPDEDIARFFHESSRYIGKARRKGGVLVHCFAGQSRSVALVLAYLIQARPQLRCPYSQYMTLRRSCVYGLDVRRTCLASKSSLAAESGALCLPTSPAQLHVLLWWLHCSARHVPEARRS